MGDLGRHLGKSQRFVKAIGIVTDGAHTHGRPVAEGVVRLRITIVNPTSETATIASVGVFPAHVKHDVNQSLGSVLLVFQQPQGVSHGKYRVVGKCALGREQLKIMVTRRVKLVCRPYHVAGNGSNNSFHNTSYVL